VADLARNIKVSSLTHIIITHLDPKAIPTLKEVLHQLAQAGRKPTVVLSNPGLRLLQSVLGAAGGCVYVCVRLVVACMRTCLWVGGGVGADVDVRMRASVLWGCMVEILQAEIKNSVVPTYALPRSCI